MQKVREGTKAREMCTYAKIIHSVSRQNVDRTNTVTKPFCKKDVMSAIFFLKIIDDRYRTLEVNGA